MNISLGFVFSNLIKYTIKSIIKNPITSLLKPKVSVLFWGQSVFVVGGILTLKPLGKLSKAKLLLGIAANNPKKVSVILKKLSNKAVNVVKKKIRLK